jgi:exodeoxyribonuclease VII small subunit
MVAIEDKKASKKIENLSFEQAMKELEDIVLKLESGSIELAASLEYYKRGTELKEFCKSQLEQAKLKVEQLILEENKPTGTEPVNLAKV